MGSIARTTRCERFVAEFDADAVSRFGLKGSFVVSQHLGTQDGWEQVFLFVLVRDGEGAETEVELMLPVLFFDPEETDEDAIARIGDLFAIEPADARRRLARAGLVAVR